MSDFFDNLYGQDLTPRRPWSQGLTDAAFDVAMTVSGGRRRMQDQAARIPPRRILVVGVSVPGRLTDMDRVVAKLGETRHEVTTSIVQMEPGLGKFENLTVAFQKVGQPASTFDWILLTDDDIAMPADFTDNFIGLTEQAGLVLAQPAHRRLSYASYRITRRRWGSLVHASRFVEIGPLTAIRGDAIANLMPFPASRWAWGLDVMWAQLAHEHGWRTGVVDGVPVSHLRPIAATYDMSLAAQEAREFLERHKVWFGRRECFSEDRIVVPWGSMAGSPAARAAAEPQHKADAALR